VFASFTVTDPSGLPASQWRAEIMFGDGQVDKLVVPVQSGNSFQFRDTHTYQTTGTFSVRVMIAIPGSHKPNDYVVMTQVTVSNPLPPPPNPQPTPTPTPTPSPGPTPSPTPTPKPPKPSFRATGLQFPARVDKTYHGFVAYFREPGTAKTQDFHVLIDWGDHSKIKPGHVHGEGNGRYAIISAHRYVKPGDFPVTITISDFRGAKIRTTAMAHVTG
jgi:hypothetical protein